MDLHDWTKKKVIIAEFVAMERRPEGRRKAWKPEKPGEEQQRKNGQR